MFGSIFNKKQNEPGAADPNAAPAGAAQTPAAPAQQDASVVSSPGAGAQQVNPQEGVPTSSNPAAPGTPSGTDATAGTAGPTADPTAASSDPVQSATATEGSADAQGGTDPNQTPAQPDAQSPAAAPGGAPSADGSALSHLDPRAAQALNHAQEEARRIKQETIEPEQLLIGLLHDEQIYKFLAESGVDGGKLSSDIQVHEKMGTYKGQPTLSKTSQDLFDQAYRDAKMRGSNFVSPEDIFVVLFAPNTPTAKYLQTYGLKKETVVEKLSKNPNSNYGKRSVLEKFGIDLTEEARQGKLDPIAGRDKEIDRMIHILVRRTKNNPIIIGETGVGKTAIVEGLAQKIVSGNVPKDLKDKRIFQLDVASLIAGASHRGEFEERLRAVIQEVLGSNNRIVLFIDEVHTLMGAGEGEGMNAANLIKPHLARGHLQIIGATTTTEYRKNFEKDKAFERRFQPVTAEEPSEENAFEMLKVLRPKYEKYHGITIPDDALKECIKLSKKYIGERYLPDKAIDLLDEGASEVKLQKDTGKRQDAAMKKADIEKVVSAWTGIPITKLTEDESEKLLKLEERIHQRLIDQEQAVVAVSEAVRRGRIGLASGNRPIASFVFLGPTGVGKTELAKTLAELLFGRDDAMARLDMSEYMEKHEVAKLIGAPPGYVGYEEGGQLTEAVRKKPYSIVLFDEIEKGHPDVFNMLLQLLEDGRLTDNKGNTISFKNTIVICTSNIGSALIQKQLGLIDPKAKKTPEEFEKAFKELQAVVKEELIKFFRPELLNRFDEVVIFKPLMPEHMAGIARLAIAKTAKLLKEQGYNLQITEKAVAQLAKDGYDPVYGARPLRRLVQTAIENPIALAIIAKKFVVGDTIVIDYNDNVNEFIFYKSGGTAVPELSEEQFKAVLLKIVHPENITSLTQRKTFTDLHTKVAQAAASKHVLAAAILKVTDATSQPEIQKLKKALQEARAKDPLVKEIMDTIDAVAQQIQAAQDLKKIILEVIDPAKVTSAKRREVFMQLHDTLVEESQRNNPLALRILAVKPDTTSDVIEQLMEDLNKEKEAGNDLATNILSVVNVEMAEEAEKARASAPETRFKRVIRELINPLYMAPADSKQEMQAVYDKLLKARAEGNPLAESLLSVSDITSDDDMTRLKKELEQAKADGDQLATEVLNIIEMELKREPLRKLKTTLLLVNNPLSAETAGQREDYTVLQSKVTEAGGKGNQLATALLAVTDATSMDEIQVLKDKLKAAKEQNDEIANLILEAADISLSEALAAADVKPREILPQQLRTALLYAVNPLKADSAEKRESYTALHDKLTQANTEVAKKVLAVTDIISDGDVKNLKEELEKAKGQNDEIAGLILEAARQEPRPQEAEEQEVSEELLLPELKKTLLQVVTPASAGTPEKAQQFQGINEKATMASQAGNELAKKVLAVTEALSDDDLKKLKEELEKAREQKDELAELVLTAASVQVAEAVKEEAEGNSALADVAASVDEVSEQQAETEPAQQTPAGDASAQPTQEQNAPQVAAPSEQPAAPASSATAPVAPANGEAFSGSQINAQPAPALGLETPGLPPMSTPAAPVAAVPTMEPMITPPASVTPGMPTGMTSAPTATDNMPPSSSNGATFGTVGQGAAMQPTYNYVLPQYEELKEEIE